MGRAWECRLGSVLSRSGRETGMSSKRKKIAISVVALTLAFALVGAVVAPHVFAQDAAEGAAQSAPPSAVIHPFEPLDPGADVITYEQLSDVQAVPVSGTGSDGIPIAQYTTATRETKMMVDQVGENTYLNCPPGALEPWSRYVADMEAKAAVESAARLIGLSSNLANTGVE